MTPEEIKAMLETEEGIEALKGLGYMAKTDAEKLAEDRTQGLVKKRDELLAKIADPKFKDAKEKAKMFDEIMQATEGFGDIEPESPAASKYENLVQMLEKAKNPGVSEDVLALKREYTKTSSEYQKLKEEFAERETALSDSESFIKGILTKNKLISMLQDNGCSRIQAESTAGYILNKTPFDVINDNGTRKAVNENGLTPEEFFTEWVETEEAKDLLPALNLNRGGNAHGSRSSGKPRDFNAELADAHKRGDRAAIIRITRESQNAAMGARR